MVGFGRGLAMREFKGLRVDQNKARELFDEVITLVMQGLETGFMEGGEIYKQPRVELRPRPLSSFIGRAFAGGGTPGSLRAMAKLGLARLYITLPSGSTIQPTMAVDHYAEAWRETHGPNATAPGSFISGLVVVDESADRAREIAFKYATNTLMAAIDHYEMQSPLFGTQKGYEAYATGMKINSQADIDKQVADFERSTIYGTPQMVLDKYEKFKTALDAQGMFPHLYFGGMPQEEAARNLMYFSKHCLPELQSWKSRSSVDDHARVAA
jgi:alkanesulfonate monooxygenase SsuD/methylene tetrahydromethanopterin reductase-like flavin-dependent oxidoreductase (luciferase family)